jgi:hypothetical protein
MKNSVLTLAAAAAVVIGLSSPASAQTGTTNMPTFELGAGYQLLRAGGACGDEVEDCEGQTLPIGLAVDALWNLRGGAFGIVAEGGGSYDSEDFTIGTDELSNSINLFHLAGGVRWTGRSNPRIWPYGQVVAGPIFNRFSSQVTGEDEVSDTVTRFMIQPGVGATFIAGDGWGIFTQVDYRRIFLDEDDDGASGRNDIRVFIGARMILD